MSDLHSLLRLFNPGTVPSGSPLVLWMGEHNMDRPATSVPLVVDLDGTLLLTDTLLEFLFGAARTKPLWLLHRLLAPRSGWARFKQDLAGAVALDVYTLPLNQPLMDYLRAQRRLGRSLYLASGADKGIALAIATRCGLFDGVLASDGQQNLTGQAKRDRLVAAFGVRGFDYIGNSFRDLPVWAEARKGLVVNPSAALLSAVHAMPQVERFSASQGAMLTTYTSAIRVQHWIKNLLLLVPALLDHKLFDSAMLGSLLPALVCFCLAASGVYILNDLLDLEADRKHPHKRNRMLASGTLPIHKALVLLVSLWMTSWCVASYLPPAFQLCLGSYVLLMLVYSLYLKRVPFVDAVALALGYSLRLMAGALAVGTDLSDWQLACSSILFFGLALLKRYAEMVLMRGLPVPDALVRGYPVEYAGRVAGVGFVASCTACVLLGLYPVATATGDGHLALWLVSALMLVWVAHMWWMAGLGRIRDDPVAFALRDPASRVLGLLTLTISLAGL